MRHETQARLIVLDLAPTLGLSPAIEYAVCAIVPEMDLSGLLTILQVALWHGPTGVQVMETFPKHALC